MKKILLSLLIIIFLYVVIMKQTQNDVVQLSSDAIDFSVVKLDSGKEFYYSHDDFAPIFSIDFAFKNKGFALDDVKKLGLSYVFLYFYKNYEISNDPEAIKNLIDEKGIKVGFDLDSENIYFSFKAISTYKDEVVSLAKLLLTNEVFNENILDQAKENMLQIYEMNQGNANFRMQQKMEEILFEDNLAVRNPYGDKKTMAAIEIKDLQNFVKQRFSQDNFHLSISGDVSIAAAKKVYNDISNELTKNSLNNVITKVAKNQNIEKTVNLKKEQVLIRAFTTSVPRNEDEFYKYYMANYIIGGSGLNSELSKVIRDKNGLTYSIHSYFDSMNDSSIWLSEFSTDKDKYNKALKLFKQALKNIYNDGIEEEELERAKKFLIGSFNINFSSNEKITGYLLDAKLKNVSLSQIKNRTKIIKSFTKQDIDSVIKDFLNPKDISFISIGDI
jgi:zinc protease